MAQRPKTQTSVQPAAGSGPGVPGARRYGAWAWFGLVLLGLAVIPTVYSGLLVSSVKDPLGNLEKVPAAVVNLDQPAESRGQTLHLGEDLVDGLVSPDAEAEGDLGWIPMGEEQAREALESGDVQAVLTVPGSFSADAAALSTGAASEAHTSTLRVETNDGTGTVMGPIAASVGEVAASTVAERIGEAYVRDVLTGFATVHVGLREAADGADRLSFGVQGATAGAEDLTLGLDRLAEGSADLHAGVSQVAGGVTDASRAGQGLAEGTAKADDGARQLHAGLSQLHQRTASLPGQTATVADGAAQVADGVGILSTGAARLETATEVLSDRIGPFAAGLNDAVAGAQRLRDGTGELIAGTAELHGTSQQVRGDVERLLTGYDSMTEEDRHAALSMLAADVGQLVDDAGQAADGAAGVDAHLGGLLGDASAGTGLSAVLADARQVADGADEAAAEISEVADTVHALSDGAGLVAAGTQDLAAETDTLVKGISGASSAAEALATGTAELDQGAGQLAASLPELAVGATELEAGSSELSSRLVVAQDGARQVATGLGDLSGRSGDLAESLRAGVAEVPAYSDREAAELASVAAAPVSVHAEKVNEVPSLGYGLAAYFMSLALWVGALGYFFARPALDTASLQRGGSVAGVAMRSIALPTLMSVVQSLLMVTVMVLVLDGQVANGWGLAGMALLASLTFFAINQALMALFGPPGQFIAPLMMVVQLAASGGMYPIETAPAVFQAIHPWLPMTYALESFRSLIAGGTIGIDQGIVVMCTYLVVSGALLLSAVWFRGRAVRGAARTLSAVPTAPLAPKEPGTVKPRALAAR